MMGAPTRPQFARGIYQPRNPKAWMLTSKHGEMTQHAVFSSKPQKINEQEFDLIPLYEVIPDD